MGFRKTAQLDENTTVFTPHERQVLSKVKPDSTLLRKYLRGSATDS